MEVILPHGLLSVASLFYIQKHTPFLFDRRCRRPSFLIGDDNGRVQAAAAEAGAASIEERKTNIKHFPPPLLCSVVNI